LSWWWLWPVCENAWERHGTQWPWVCKERQGYGDAYCKMNEISFLSLKIGGNATLDEEFYIRVNLPCCYCAYSLVNALSWRIL